MTVLPVQRPSGTEYWLPAVTFTDDTIPHQIRLRLAPGNHLVVSCRCGRYGRRLNTTDDIANAHVIYQTEHESQLPAHGPAE